MYTSKNNNEIKRFVCNDAAVPINLTIRNYNIMLYVVLAAAGPMNILSGIRTSECTIGSITKRIREKKKSKSILRRAHKRVCVRNSRDSGS